MQLDIDFSSIIQVRKELVMKGNATGRFLIGATVTFVMAVASIMFFGCSDNTVAPSSDLVNGIYKIDSKPFGKSYAEWSAAWWQWAFGQPATDASNNVIHPLLDTTGAFSANGQTAGSDVYFLGGALGSNAPITRNCTVPPGKAIFFPMVNFYADTTGGWTVDSMRVALDGINSKITEVSAQIDGQGVASTTTYHVRSQPFSITLPDHNLYQLMGNPLPAGTVMPFLSDGYWLMLAPMTSGTHTIHFFGKTSDGVLEDVTYHLTVQ